MVRRRGGRAGRCGLKPGPALDGPGSGFSMPAAAGPPPTPRHRHRHRHRQGNTHATRLA